ncbi:MAG: HAMP domain-containing sensor histidine kinase [Acidimicrobiia bacterium]|nr:HAMP domain-containing sensor histidine kinase [Acidimicrobiia bacterium]MDX2467439.1 HAMP domain-containing sensor histidine kinase [Acidimicrobiia bacterium]
MVTRRAADSRVGQSLPWFVAAVLVVVGSGLIALWLNNTAATADQDTLERGADAVASNIEEQIRILELAGTGAGSLAGQPLADIDVISMLSQVDITVLRSLLAIVSYPFDQDGAGQGEFLLNDFQDLQIVNFEVPSIDVSLAEFEDLITSGQAFLSQPFHTDDPDRLDYVVAIPVTLADGVELVGVVFRPDRMLDSAVEAAGEGQYAVEVVDTRYGNQVVVAAGEPAAAMETSRIPKDILAALEVIVRPAAGFPSVRSPWISRLVVGTGVLIALLLVWMGRMVKARAGELAERLRLAQQLNESKDRFLATVSHELRTPLTVVLGVASEVGPNWESFDDTDRHDLMQMMIEQASEAANIVEDLLVAARSDPSQLRLAMEQTGLLSHVEYALASLPDDSRSRVACRNLDREVYADSTRLRQILRNLLENAVKYGGPEITVHSDVVAGQVVVTVGDNGTSLAAADRLRIFEPYEQSSDEGSQAPSGVGIGLYVSRLLAQLMNGELECVSADGPTEFRLTLSVVDPNRIEALPIVVAAS